MAATAYIDAQANNDSEKNTRQYTDLDLFFSKKISDSDISKVTDIQAVKRSVRNLILLNHYEKPFHPEIGSGVRDILFEPMTAITAIILNRKIEDTINNFEPRVKLLKTKVSPNFETLEFDVVISYEIIGIEAQPQQLSFALEPAR